MNKIFDFRISKFNSDECLTSMEYSKLMLCRTYCKGMIVFTLLQLEILVYTKCYYIIWNSIYGDLIWYIRGYDPLSQSKFN